LINPISVWHALQVAKKLKAIVNGLNFSEWTQTEKLIVSFFKSQVSSSAIYALKYNAWKKALRKNRPSSITLIDENSPLTRCVVDAARDCDVPTFAVQHGSIHDQHPAYMFSAQDQHRNIFPTFTLTWGDHWKNVLIEKGNYPKDSIYVSGQQRTDTIFQLIEMREQLRASFFQSNVPVILFATQPQQDAQMRKRIAQDFFESLLSLPQALGVLKLHPAEKNQDGFYLDIAKEVGCSNFKIQHDTDLYALIAAADVVITAFSTVGTESVYFRKPIVIWDPLNLDLLGLIKQDLAWGVKNVSDLSAALNRIINEGERKEDVVFDRFIQQYAFKIDGSSSKRICDFIQSHSK
jgi:CDP-glycerol glycerophosphotransferase (TagB/SpsB family)